MYICNCYFESENPYVDSSNNNSVSRHLRIFGENGCFTYYNLIFSMISFPTDVQVFVKLNRSVALLESKYNFIPVECSINYQPNELLEEPNNYKISSYRTLKDKGIIAESHGRNNSVRLM